jgi:DNA-binding transcriptional LysR family regulator
VKGSELLSEPFVTYPGMDVLFEIWHGETFAQKTIPALRDLKCAGAINDLAAAITMVTHGLGLAVFPRHCVQPFIDKKKLTVYRGSKTPARYPIYLIRMKGARSTARVQKVIEAFAKMT